MKLIITEKVIAHVEKLSRLGYLACGGCSNCPGHIDYNDGLYCEYTSWRMSNRQRTACEWLENNNDIILKIEKQPKNLEG